MPTTTNPSAPLRGDYRDFSKGGRYGPTGANAPQQTGTERGRAQFDYWETDPAKVNAYLQANASDPKLLAAAQQGTNALDHELHNRGIRVPEHYKADVDDNGQLRVEEMSWWDKHKNWALPAIGMGAAIAAPYALGALGGGGSAAPAASAGGGVGLGETGAVAGLGGSGFGGAAGAAGGAASAAGAGAGRGAILKGLGVAGRVAAGAGQGRHNQRMDETMANQSQDRIGLESARLNLQAPGMHAGNAVQGDILSGAQDVSFAGPLTGTKGVKPTISGGLRPSLMSGDTRALGKQMSRDAMLAQLKGPAFTPSKQPKPNTGDALLGGIGTAGAIAGVLDETGLLKKYGGGWF